MPSLARLALGAALLALTTPFAPSSARADTPPGILVMAQQIDDIISLDPAEIFEFSGAEYGAQVYDRLVTYDPNDVSKIYGRVAESWTIGPDGKTFVFRIRDGIAFHSGNELTAEDVAWSLQRVVKLDKTPAFILGQFGFTPDNVEQKIRVTGPAEVTLELDKPYAPTFVLYCLTAGVGSVLDRQLLLEHEEDGDMGHAWLRAGTDSDAGSGPFALRSWKPNESLTYDANADYWDGAPALRRVINRNIGERATQQLLLEKGDIDVARNLGPDQLTAVQAGDGIRLTPAPKGTIYYMSLNQKNPDLAKPEVREAMKHLLDYAGLADTIMKGIGRPHEAFLPQGFLGAVEDRPYGLNVARAKELLARAGLPNGFTVTMDVRNVSPYTDIAEAFQATAAQAGVTIELIPGDGGQTLTKYRARSHDIYIGQWGPDYQDPHTNADAFASNPNNADDAQFKTLAWRNAWDIPEMTKRTAAAVLERDAAKRAALYESLQREHQKTSPFVIMFQQVEVVAERAGVEGMIYGPSFDSVFYAKARKAGE